MKRAATIILIEDQQLDVVLIRECFGELKREVSLKHFPLAEMAIEYFSEASMSVSAELPKLILLSKDVPLSGGITLLKQIKNHPRLSGIPVIMFFNAASQDEISEAYKLGASSCIQKLGIEEYYRHLVLGLIRFWLEANSSHEDEEMETVPARSYNHSQAGVSLN